MQHTLDYPTMIDQAMRAVVRDALKFAEKQGLPGDHHFFISFHTNASGVKLSPALKSRYPEEMTIVLQYQYNDLVVEAERFSVTLSFNNVPEKLVIPFTALTAFADPSVKFGLQFHGVASDHEGGDEPPPESGGDADADSGSTVERGSKVLSLDAFRKK